MSSSDTGADGRRVILLVDDEDGVRAFARDALELSGFEVEEAASLAEATVKFREDGERFDLVLVDYLLGSDSGLDLAASLRQQRPALPVVIMSGMAGSIAGETILEKPFDLATLSRTVENALAKA